MRDLTPKQQRFVDEFLIDLNGTAAYQRAGYHTKKGNSSEAAAARLLRNVKVWEKIQEAQQQRSERLQFTQDDVLRELTILSHSSMNDYRVDEQGRVTVAPGVHPDAIRAISSLKRRVIHRGSGEKKETVYETELKLWDKPASVKMEGQHRPSLARCTRSGRAEKARTDYQSP